MALVPVAPSFYTFWDQVDRTNTALYNDELDKFFSHPCIQNIVQALEDNEVDSYIPHQVGYVYAAWNVLFSDLVKIGATMRSPYVRVKELSGAGVPTPFEMVAYIPSENPFRLEREIHDYFGSMRKYGRKKEFFTLSRSEILEHFHLRSSFAVIKPDVTFDSFVMEDRDYPKRVWLVSYDAVSPSLTHQQLLAGDLVVSECYTLLHRDFKYTLLSIPGRVRLSFISGCIRRMKDTILRGVDGREAIAGYYGLNQDLQAHPAFRAMVENIELVDKWLHDGDIYTNKTSLLFSFIVPADLAGLTKARLMTVVTNLKRKYESKKEENELLAVQLAERDRQLAERDRQFDEAQETIQRLRRKTISLQALYEAAAT